jgi:ankyrin repeat protein
MDAVRSILEAVEAGDVPRVKALLAQDPGLVLASSLHDKTILHTAAERNHPEVVEALLDAGAPPEAETTWGMTPLQWAANMGSAAAARVLVARGARLNLWAAAGLGLLDEVRGFWDGGRLRPGAGQARFRKRADGGWRKAPVPWDVREVVSDAFYIACRNGHTDVARFLLYRGADVDARGFFGGTALHWAARNGHRDTVELLLAHGAITDLEDDEFHATPRGWAEQFDHRDIAALLY